MSPNEAWIFRYIEQRYLAEQAELLLQQCLERRSPAPLQSLLKRLVLEGPQNIHALHLVLKLVHQRRAELEEDAQRLWRDLAAWLQKRGLSLPTASPWEALQLDAEAVQRWAAAAANPEQSTEVLNALRNAQSVLRDLHEAEELLKEIEDELESWAWGLARLAALASSPLEKAL